MRALVCLVVILAIAHARPAGACSRPYISMFRTFDRADTVAHARVQAIGKGTITFAVIKAFKGATGNTITVEADIRSTCTPVSKVGQTGVLFVEGRHITLESFPRASKERLAATAAYASASDAAKRAAVLVDFALHAGGAQTVAFDAGLALADDPAALLAITDADRDRMIAALPKLDADSYVPLVLVRIGAPIEKSLSKYGGELALLKNRVFENVTSADELAKVIEAAPDGKASGRAAAAFERCERLHGTHLFSVRHTVANAVEDGVGWKAFAAICRSGKRGDEI